MDDLLGAMARLIRSSRKLAEELERDAAELDWEPTRIQCDRCFAAWFSCQCPGQVVDGLPEPIQVDQTTMRILARRHYRLGGVRS